jgi:hypothetical protein
MNQPALKSSFDDLLTDDDLVRVTRIPKRARDRLEKTKKVLKDAGIYFWVCGDGSIATTWHHIHNPNRPDTKKPDELDPNMPNFGAMKK